MKTVTQEEFDAFIESCENRIGRKLVASLLTIAIPEQIQHNDFERGDWPESVVASQMPEHDSAGNTYPKEYRVRVALSTPGNNVWKPGVFGQVEVIT